MLSSTTRATSAFPTFHAHVRIKLPKFRHSSSVTRRAARLSRGNEKERGCLIRERRQEPCESPAVTQSPQPTLRRKAKTGLEISAPAFIPLWMLPKPCRTGSETCGGLFVTPLIVGAELVGAASHPHQRWTATFARARGSRLCLRVLAPHNPKSCREHRASTQRRGSSALA